MKQEALILSAIPPFRGKRKPDITVRVAYVGIAHYYDGENAAGRSWKAYEVHVDGAKVGEIHQCTASTDRHAGRIRIPGRGKVAWSWRAVDGQRNYPGVYPSTRISAVAEIMGYDYARRATDGA